MKKIKIIGLIISIIWVLISCDNQGDINLISIKTNKIEVLNENKIECSVSIDNNSGHSILEKGICWSTDSLFSDYLTNFQSINTNDDDFSIKSDNTLFPSTKYYVKAYAIIERNTYYGNTLTFSTESNKIGFYTDSRDNKTYKIVYVGENWWFAENLDFEIDGVYRQLDVNTNKYNSFYTWETANLACPQDCKIPTDNDWMKLETAIGMTNEQLTEDNWRTCYANQLLINGIQSFDIKYIGYLTPKSQGSENLYNETTCRFWSQTEENYGAYSRGFASFANFAIYRKIDDKEMQYPVRCILK